MKTCHLCSTEKPVSQFYRHRDGFRPECKACTRRDKNPYQRAYSRALQQLRLRHPDEFDLIFNDEFDRVWEEAS